LITGEGGGLAFLAERGRTCGTIDMDGGEGSVAAEPGGKVGKRSGGRENEKRRGEKKFPREVWS